MSRAIEKWHHLMDSKNMGGLDTLLAEDAIFLSPIVHTPQMGRAMVKLYLEAAGVVFNNGKFRYTKEIIDAPHAVLEFETEMDGIKVNGIDMITWNDKDEIIEFKVMVRPLKAINMVHAKMMEMLAAMSGKDPAAKSSA